MRVAYVLILASVMLTGCTQTFYVRSDEERDHDKVLNYDQLKARVNGGPGTVVCVDGTTYVTSGVFVAADSIMLTAPGSGVRQVLPARCIKSIQYQDRALGAFSGALLGSLGGLGVGIGVIVAQIDHSHDGGLGAAVLVLGAMSAGALMGAVVGSFDGGTQVFHFSEHQNAELKSADSSTTATHSSSPDIHARER